MGIMTYFLSFVKGITIINSDMKEYLFLDIIEVMLYNKMNRYWFMGDIYVF